MSRTIRRSKLRNSALKYNICSYNWVYFDNGLYHYSIMRVPSSIDSDYFKDNARKFHSEKRKYNATTTYAKWEAKRILRSSTKTQLSRVYKLADYEDFEFDKSNDKVLLECIWSCN